MFEREPLSTRLFPADLILADRIGGLIEYPTPQPEFVHTPKGMAWRHGNAMVPGLSSWDQHTLAMAHFYGTLGLDWAASQQRLPVNKRHVTLRWYAGYKEWESCYVQALERSTSLPPVTGPVIELVMLAYDLYYLRWVGALPTDAVDRLRHHEQFQGVRHELSIAGALARLGFGISWTTGQSKHHDFDACCPVTSEIVAFETKSRHVKGTIHTAGSRNAADDARFKGHRQYQEAATQGPADRPFIIVLDLNLPLRNINSAPSLEVAEQVQRMVRSSEASYAHGQFPETLLALTNYAWHYHDAELPAPPFVEYIGNPRPRQMLRHIETLAGITRALHDRSEPRFLGRFQKATPRPKGSRSHGRAAEVLKRARAIGWL